MYYAFIHNEKLNGIGQCRILNEDYINLEISEELYRAMEQDVDKYVYRDGQIVLDENNPKMQLKVARATLAEAEQKMTALDYIGVKIATGRATVEEYADKIAEMNALADKVNELRQKISELEKSDEEN